MSRSYDKIGFVGVGAMGKHMVLNLAKKSPYGTQIFICDINTVAVEELCSSNPDVISPCFSAREVASKSVRGPRSMHSLLLGETNKIQVSRLYNAS